MRKAVLDTNVVLALRVYDDPRLAVLRAALAAGQIQPVRDAACDQELARVLARPQFGLTEARQADLLDGWQAAAMPVADAPVQTPPGLTCRDADDRKFVALALRASAGWLFTRDRALLALARRAPAAGFVIMAPDALAAGFAAGLATA